MAYKLTFKEVNGTSTLIIPFIELYIENDMPNSGFNLYENSVDWLSQITNRPSYEDLANGNINRTYKCVEKPNLEFRISFSRISKKEAGYTRCGLSGTFYFKNKYTGIYGGTEYPNPAWYLDGITQTAYGGQQIVGFDRTKKLFVSMYTGKCLYEANYFKPGETGKYRAENMLVKNIFVQKGYYKYTDWYVGSQKISTALDVVTAPFGSIITNGNWKSTNKSFYPNLWDDFWGGEEPPKYPDNPDDPENPDDDPTDPTPGTGDGTSDPIPVPPKPTTDVTGTGFVTLYNPSAIEIRQLAYFMWSGDFADILKKIFRAPFDCIIGLKLLYAPLSTGASQAIWLGNVETTVSASKITDQFIDFDCGELVIAEYFGSFLDYTPYTKISIFLPFIGYKQLNVDEVMNATIHLTYRIDVYSGACIAFLKVTKTITSTNLNSVLYSFDGNCAMDIPFTAGDMSRYVAAILGTAASTAGAVISNPMPSEAPLNTGTDATKNPNEKHLSDLGNTSANLVAAKPQIQRGGSLAGANSSMGIKQPYIIIERPLQQMPYNYPNYIGIPLNMTKTLSQVSGFTVVSDIFMASSQATDEEIKMITSKLKQGVVL